MFYQLPIYNQTSTAWRDVSYFSIPDGDQLKQNFLFATSEVLIPLVAVLGVAGNIVSMLVLYKNGLKKCSNILIFYLALADTFYLLGINNIPLEIYLSMYIRFGYFTTESGAFCLYCMFHLFVLMETIGKVASMVLPTLIIAERFTAVYFPLYFTRIFTVRRVRTAALGIFPIGVPVYVLYNPMTAFVYTVDPASNETVGLILKSRTYTRDSQSFSIVSEVYSAFCGPCCVGVVVLGCVLISVRIQLQVRRRKSMATSGNSSVKNLVISHLNRRSISKRSEKAGGSLTDVDGRTEQISAMTQNNLPRSYSDNQFDAATFQKTQFPCSKDGPTDNTKVGNSDNTKDGISDQTKDGNSENTKDGDTDNIKAVPEKASREVTNGSKTRHRKRTTQILLSVCVVYSITGTFNFLCDMVFSSRNLSYSTSVMIHRTGILVLCVNSAANFIIYVVFNRNFRETYTRMFCNCL